MAEQSETTLRRGMSILFAFGTDEALAGGGLGVVRIAELVGREKSQVSRTLKTLEECQLLSRDPGTLQYRLSWQLFTLAARAGVHQLVELCPAVLEKVVSQFEETAYVSVLEGSTVLTVAAQDGSRIVKASSTVGRATPAYCTSAGQALLMDRSADQIRSLFSGVDFVRHAPCTPADVEELIERISTARVDGGVAVSDEEYEAALIGIAAPVRDAAGRIVAALNISGPKFRLGAHLDVARHGVLAHAQELSAQLGAPPPASDLSGGAAAHP